MYYTLVILVTALLCAWALSWLYSRRARALLSGLARIRPLPLLGDVLALVGNPETIYQLVLNISEKIEEHQKPLVFWLGPQPIVIVSDPEDVKVVNNAFVEKPVYYNFARVWLGDGLVTAPGTIWKRSIKKLAGTFTGPIVDGYQEVFNAQALKLVGQLRGEAGGAPFDVMDDLALTTLEAICHTALGVARISESQVTAEYYQAFNRTLELLLRRGVNPLLHPDWLYRRTPAYKELIKCVGVLHNVSNTVIAKRRKEFNDKKQNGMHEEHKLENSPLKFCSFLDILLELSEADPWMTEEQIRAEVDTIILGGQETVATTLLYTILMIGSKPELQDKLYAEMKSIFGASKRPVVKEDLARMTYCEAVIYETLRLFPPVPMVMRDADRDCQLRKTSLEFAITINLLPVHSRGSCTIPKGAACAVNVLGAGRSRRTWGADALQFRPERWAPSATPAALAAPPPAAFLAFSYGKRACIGKRYAMALMKTVLAYCVRELEFSSQAEQLRFKLDIALKPVSGHLVQVALRQ